MLKSSKHRLFATCNCCAPDLGRREFVASGIAALGVGALAAPAFLSGAQAQAKPHRIDVHHHIMPPTWLAAMDVVGRTDFLMRNWSVQKTLEDMDKGGVATSMTSITLPQVGSIGKDVAVRIARHEDGDRPSCALRRLGDAAAAAHRREPEGDRLCARHAQT
jgi:hypothetical protein